MYTYTEVTSHSRTTIPGLARQPLAAISLCCLAGLACLSLTGCAVERPAQYDGYVLDWSDEFRGTKIDTSVWRFIAGGGGYGNNELQYYTNAPDNARVENGCLILEARKEKKAGWPYTSAKLETRGRKPVLYGRLDVRARLPRGRGSWPAIWMLPENQAAYGSGWPDSGEIDIMEHVGYEPGIVHVTVHTAAYNHRIGTQKGTTVAVPDAMDEFHVYGLEWTPEYLRWYVDGLQVHAYQNDGAGWKSWPFDTPYYLILNIACGGDWGGSKGIDNESLPWTMAVDWVRAYKPVAIAGTVSGQ